MPIRKSRAKRFTRSYSRVSYLVCTIQNVLHGMVYSWAWGLCLWQFCLHFWWAFCCCCLCQRFSNKPFQNRFSGLISWTVFSFQFWWLPHRGRGHQISGPHTHTHTEYTRKRWKLGRKACFKQKAKLFLSRNRTTTAWATTLSMAPVRLNGHFGNNNPRTGVDEEVAS